MAQLITLSFHGSQCGRQPQQDVHLTEALFSGDMFFTLMSGNDPHANNYALNSAAPHHFCVKNTVLDKHFHNSKNSAEIFI